MLSLELTVITLRPVPAAMAKLMDRAALTAPYQHKPFADSSNLIVIRLGSDIPCPLKISGMF